MNTIIIYEIYQSNFLRYVLPLTKKIIEKHAPLKVVFLGDSFLENDLLVQLPEFKNGNILLWYTKDLKNKLKGNPNINIIAYLNFSYRIPDLYWTMFFKRRNVPTYQVQHGMYVKYLKRSLRGVFSQTYRNTIYLKYLFKIPLQLQSSEKIKTFLYLLNKDFINSSFLRRYFSSKDFTEIKSDTIFIWGEYWKKWFKETHYYNTDDNFVVIGNRDYYNNIAILSGPIQDSICYICQTFVEDSRMSKIQFNQFLKVLAKTIKETPEKLFQIKFHPRSNKTLYKELLELSNVKEAIKFPKCKKYIGHYSTILSLAFSEYSSVCLWTFEGHDIPSYFINLASLVTNDMSEMQQFLNDNEIRKINPNCNIDTFLYRTKIDPDDIIVNTIIDNLVLSSSKTNRV